MTLQKLSIGTANFGRNYNLINNFRIKNEKIKKIFLYLKKKNIFFIDTAQVYKNDKILKSFSSKTNEFITKIDIKTFSKYKKKWNLENNYLITLKNKLNITRFYGVLIHIANYREIEQRNCKELFIFLKNLKKKRLIKKIGFSIYEPRDAYKILKIFKFDLIQIPLNLFDNRFEKSGYLKKFKKKNIEIHTRSIFLQGLLLEDKIPKKFITYNRKFNQLDSWVKLNNISKLDACIQYVLKFPEIDKIVVGFNSLDQLKQIVSRFKKKKKTYFSKELGISSTKLIDPRKWL